jgi:hypothetical protein
MTWPGQEGGNQTMDKFMKHWLRPFVVMAGEAGGAGGGKQPPGATPATPDDDDDGDLGGIEFGDGFGVSPGEDPMAMGPYYEAAEGDDDTDDDGEGDADPAGTDNGTPGAGEEGAAAQPHPLEQLQAQMAAQQQLYLQQQAFQQQQLQQQIAEQQRQQQIAQQEQAEALEYQEILALQDPVQFATRMLSFNDRRTQRLLAQQKEEIQREYAPALQVAASTQAVRAAKISYADQPAELMPYIEETVANLGIQPVNGTIPENLKMPILQMAIGAQQMAVLAKGKKAPLTSNATQSTARRAVVRGGTPASLRSQASAFDAAFGTGTAKKVLARGNR